MGDMNEQEKWNVARFQMACKRELIRDAEQKLHHKRVILKVRLSIYGAFAAYWLGVGCVANRPVTKAEILPPAEEAVVWTADDVPDAGSTYARAMPPEPISGQKRPNAKGECGPRQVAIRSTPASREAGCWKKLADPPTKQDGCGEDFEYLGVCYAPVKEAKRTPTSIEP